MEVIVRGKTPQEVCSQQSASVAPAFLEQNGRSLNSLCLLCLVPGSQRVITRRSVPYASRM